MPPEKAAVQFAESIKPIIERAESLGIDVGIECEPGLFLEYIAELREWIERLGTSALRRQSRHRPQPGDRRIDSDEVVSMLKGRIWNLHVEDIPGRKHYHMIPGEGTLDWDSLKVGVARDSDTIASSPSNYIPTPKIRRKRRRKALRSCRGNSDNGRSGFQAPQAIAPAEALRERCKTAGEGAGGT